MNNISRNEKGFSAVETVLVLVIIALIGSVGWFVHKDYHKVATAPAYKVTTTATTKTTTPVTAPTSTDPYAGWKVYSNQDAGLTFKYPPSWTSQATENTPYADGSFAGVSGTLTAPSGNTLYWIYQVAGGKGDAGCTPAASDTPFASGNACPTKQIINVEQIPSVKAPTDKTFGNLFGDSLYITETKIGGNYEDPVTGKQVNGGPNYQICLDPFTAGEGSNPPAVGTEMGFELPCEYWDTGFNVTFPVANQTDFNSADAKTAILIMKSFNSL